MSGVAGRIAVSGVVLLLAQAPGAEAQETQRFVFRQVDGGYLAFDTKTGTQLVCRQRAAGWACSLIANERRALQGEIARLADENERLRSEIARLKEAAERAGGGVRGKAGERRQTRSRFSVLHGRFVAFAKTLRARFENNTW